MKLLKIRNQFINIDMLESVTIERDVITISIAGEQYLFAGEEATVLMDWFNQYAFDLMNNNAISIDRIAEEQKSIEALHSQIQTLGLFRKPFALE